jgi:hypothetical protein
VKGMDQVWVFCMQIPSFPSNIHWRGSFSPLYIFGSFVQNQGSLAVWTHIWVFYSVPLVCMSVFMPVSCQAYT